MSRVLLISYSGVLGGAERILVDFAAGLPGEVVLACPEGGLAEAGRRAGWEVAELPARSLLLRGGARVTARAARYLVEHGRRARRLVAELEPDAVVAWGMRSALACLLGPGLPCPVVFQHNDFLPGHPAVAGAVRRAASRAALVVALSRASASDLDPGGRLGGRLVVVPPGVAVERFEREAPEAAEEPGRVLLLGAVVGWKRPGLALEACALARRRCPQLHLRVVGQAFSEDGPALERRLRRRAAQPDLAGAVSFPGAVPDPVAELERASVLLHCAPREPFGLVVVEAMAAGRPVVVPAAGGPAETVDASTGRLYPPGDATAAAEALVEILGDPELARRLGEAGRERARQQYGVAAARERWTSLVTAVTEGGLPPAPG